MTLTVISEQDFGTVIKVDNVICWVPNCFEFICAFTDAPLLVIKFITSGYNDSFEYFTGGNCTVVDLSKVVQYKLQNERDRHTR